MEDREALDPAAKIVGTPDDNALCETAPELIGEEVALAERQDEHMEEDGEPEIEAQADTNTFPGTVSEQIGEEAASVGVVRERMEDLSIDSPHEGAQHDGGEGGVEAPTVAGTTDEGNCPPGGGLSNGGVADRSPSKATAGTPNESNGSRRGGRAEAPSSSKAGARGQNRSNRSNKNRNEPWQKVERQSRKRHIPGPPAEWTDLLKPRSVIPAARKNMNISNGTKGFAPAYYSEIDSIISPRILEGGDSGPAPFIRELSCKKDILRFRERTMDLVESNTLRPPKTRPPPPASGRDATQVDPSPIEGKRPVLYRMTPYFKGQYRFLEAVHFDVYIKGRPDLRVIQMDHFTQNVDKTCIMRDDCVTGDLFWVYDVSVLNKKARRDIMSGGVDVNGFLDATELFAQWSADLVAPLPRAPTETRLCMTNKKVTPGYDLTIPGNIEPCSVVDGFHLEKDMYVLADVRTNEAGWCFPVEPVEDNKWEYLDLIKNVRSLYCNRGPFALSATEIDDDVRELLEDRVGDFRAYHVDRDRAQRILSDSIALGVAIRARSEAVSKRLDMQVTVIGATCDLPHPPEVALEVQNLPYTLDQLEKVTLHRRGPLPKMVVTPKSVELVDEYKNISVIVGTIEMSAFAALHEHLVDYGLSMNDFRSYYDAHIYPKIPLLDPISEMTSSGRVGEPGPEDEMHHHDRLYGTLSHKPCLPQADNQVTVRLVGGNTITLNVNQSRAVREVIDNLIEALVVKSPPGSGKTFVAAVIAALEANRKVVMLASTNSAVKNMADAFIECELSEGKRAMRVVAAQTLSRMSREDKSPLDLDEQLPRIMEEVNSTSDVPAIRRTASDYLRLRKDLWTLDEEIAKSSGASRSNLLREYAKVSERFQLQRYKAIRLAKKVYVPNVVMCTIDYAVMTSGDTMKEVGLVLIDEASQVTEAQLLCVIRKAPKAAIVLIGDPNQLNPYRYENIMVQKLAAQSAISVATRNGGFAEIQLDRVYRATPSLTRLYSNSFYGGQLYPVRAETHENVLVEARMLPRGSRPFILVDIVNTTVDRSANRSLRNETEADQALKAVKALKGAGVAYEQILVICFYAYQQALLRRYFAAERINVEVLTVDSAQGRQRKVVLLLTTRTKGGRVTFFEDPRRINVAISRQTDALIVFGNPQLLRTLEAWKTFVMMMEENNSVRASVLMKEAERPGRDERQRVNERFER